MISRMWNSLGSAVKKAVGPQEQDARRAPRLPGPPVVAYYWDGATPEGRRLLDISQTGAYLCTDERWYVGTLVRLIVQKHRCGQEEQGHAGQEESPDNSVCIPCRVVRKGADGVGVEFLFPSVEERESVLRFIAALPPRPLDKRAGQSLVEFSLILPLMFLLVMNLVNFGGLFFAWISLSGAVRTGAQYMAMSTASIGKPTAPTAAQVQTAVTNDMSSLLNRSSLVVRVCTNDDGTVSCTGSGSQTPPADPEPSTFVLGSVDGTYTYVPYISQWNFSRLGIALTLPTTTIHQRAVARLMQ